MIFIQRMGCLRCLGYFVGDFWRKYVGLDGASVGINTYGESAPGGDLFKHFGFTVENVIKTVKTII